MRDAAAVVASGTVADLLDRLVRSERAAPRWMIGRELASLRLAPGLECRSITRFERIEWLPAADELPDRPRDGSCSQQPRTMASRRAGSGGSAGPTTNRTHDGPTPRRGGH
jgi:hypothetical protein